MVKIINSTPLRRIGAGSQFKVYAGKSQVYKVPRKLMPKLTRFAFPLDKPIESYRRAEQIPEMTLPFNIEPAVECAVSFLGVGLRRRFSQVVIQPQVTKEQLLGHEIYETFATGDIQKLDGIFSEMLAFQYDLIRAGFFLPDPIPNNFCRPNGEIKLLDCGTLQNDLSFIKHILATRKDYQDFIVNLQFALGLMFNLEGLAKQSKASDQTFNQALAVLKKYGDKVIDMVRPRTLNRLWLVGPSQVTSIASPKE